MFNRNLFRAKVIECGLTLKRAASLIGCNEATLYRKMSGKSDFSRDEIQKLIVGLSLTLGDVDNIFFA